MSPHVEVNAWSRAAWPALPAAAHPGTVRIDDTGVRVMVLEDGTAREIGEVPRRRSVAADPSARRGA